MSNEVDGRTPSYTYPGGSACLYMHLSPPLGQIQNQPYFPYSIASMKYLQTLTVVVRWFPFMDKTTERSFSSSQSADVTVYFISTSSALEYVYRIHISH